MPDDSPLVVDIRRAAKGEPGGIGQSAELLVGMRTVGKALALLCAACRATVGRAAIMSVSIQQRYYGMSSRDWYRVISTFLFNTLRERTQSIAGYRLGSHLMSVFLRISAEPSSIAPPASRQRALTLEILVIHVSLAISTTRTRSTPINNVKQTAQSSRTSGRYSPSLLVCEELCRDSSEGGNGQFRRRIHR
jgi:hypothetical protein